MPTDITTNMNIYIETYHVRKIKAHVIKMFNNNYNSKYNISILHVLYFEMLLCYLFYSYSQQQFVDDKSI